MMAKIADGCFPAEQEMKYQWGEIFVSTLIGVNRVKSSQKGKNSVKIQLTFISLFCSGSSVECVYVTI